MREQRQGLEWMVCSMRVMDSLVMCVQCGRWIHGRCAGVRRVTVQCGRWIHGRCAGVRRVTVQCGRWIHGRCAGVRRVTAKFIGNFACRKCERNIAEEYEEKFCVDVETVWEFTYLGDRVSAGGGCETAVTSRTRCGWVKFWKFGELLYGMGFPP